MRYLQGKWFSNLPVGDEGRRFFPILIVKLRSPSTCGFEIRQGYKKSCSRREMKVREGKVREIQNAAQPLAAHERVGPAELEKF